MADLNVIPYRPERSDYVWTFGGADPVMTVKPGDVLELWTDDCFTGLVSTVDDLASEKITFPFLNPVSGPFFVEGAEPGDTLALHFAAITPATDRGVSSTFPHFGALTSTHTTATLQGPLEERVWMYDIDTAAGTVRFHASQGDACGVAVECAMTTTLVVDLIKGTPTPWPRLETDQALMSIGCARPLEDAYRIAHTDLVHWTAALTGMDVLDAYQLLSQAGTA